MMEEKKGLRILLSRDDLFKVSFRQTKNRSLGYNANKDRNYADAKPFKASNYLKCVTESNNEDCEPLESSENLHSMSLRFDVIVSILTSGSNLHDVQNVYRNFIKRTKENIEDFVWFIVRIIGDSKGLEWCKMETESSVISLEFTPGVSKNSWIEKNLFLADELRLSNTSKRLEDFDESEEEEVGRKGEEEEEDVMIIPPPQHQSQDNYIGFGLGSSQGYSGNNMKKKKGKSNIVQPPPNYAPGMGQQGRGYPPMQMGYPNYMAQGFGQNPMGQMGRGYPMNMGFGQNPMGQMGAQPPFVFVPGVGLVPSVSRGPQVFPPNQTFPSLHFKKEEPAPKTLQKTKKKRKRERKKMRFSNKKKSRKLEERSDASSSEKKKKSKKKVIVDDEDEDEGEIIRKREQLDLTNVPLLPPTHKFPTGDAFLDSFKDL